MDNLRTVTAVVGGAILGVIMSEKLPSKVIDGITYHYITPFLLIFVLSLLLINNRTKYNIGVLLSISIILALISYISYDYLENEKKQENMIASLKLEKSLNNLGWFEPTRTGALKLQ